VPAATGGLLYELDPATGTVTPRPALGAKAHEGIRVDAQGNVYGISESNPGYIFKFTPDRRGDLSSGQLYALKIVQATGDRTGEAEWMALDRSVVKVNANTAAAAVGATGYNRPEDLELATSTGNNRGGASILYVNITDPSTDSRTLAVDLQEPGGDQFAFVYDYVKVGLNASAAFSWSDNVALDHSGNLYITEDPPSNPIGTGADIWVAEPPSGGQHQPAASVVRFTSLTDCNAEPTGIYFDKDGGTLYVHAQHRGGDGLDKDVAVRPAS
jgi:uncharacterized protein